MIIKRRITRSFVTLENELVRDRRLALDEHGMLHYLLSLPDDWEVSRANCAKFWNIGREKVARIFQSLKRTGWAKVELLKAEDGTIVGKRWIIGDLPGPEVADIADEADEEDEASPVHQDEPSYGLAVARVNRDTGKPYDGRKIDSNIQNPPTPQTPQPTEAPQEAAEETKGEPIPPNRGQPKFSILKLNWPADHILSAVAAERKFLRLKEPEQWAAIDRAPAYIADIRSRGWKLGDLTTYLREKRWERLASPTPTASWATRGGTPRAYRWLEYREAMGEPTAYMRDCFATGKPWYAPSEWPPALPKRESTGPPSSLMTAADHEELTRGI